MKNVPISSIVHAALGGLTGAIVARHMRLTGFDFWVIVLFTTVNMVAVSELFGFMMRIQILLRKIQFVKLP